MYAEERDAGAIVERIWLGKRKRETVRQRRVRMIYTTLVPIGQNAIPEYYLLPAGPRYSSPLLLFTAPTPEPTCIGA